MACERTVGGNGIMADRQRYRAACLCVNRSSEHQNRRNHICRVNCWSVVHVSQIVLERKAPLLSHENSQVDVLRAGILKHIRTIWLLLLGLMSKIERFWMLERREQPEVSA
jgi:hypothetical protein